MAVDGNGHPRLILMSDDHVGGVWNGRSLHHLSSDPHVSGLHMDGEGSVNDASSLHDGDPSVWIGLYHLIGAVYWSLIGHERLLLIIVEMESRRS